MGVRGRSGERVASQGGEQQVRRVSGRQESEQQGGRETAGGENHWRENGWGREWLGKQEGYEGQLIAGRLLMPVEIRLLKLSMNGNRQAFQPKR
jgi:hypothetical protein